MVENNDRQVIIPPLVFALKKGKRQIHIHGSQNFLK